MAGGPTLLLFDVDGTLVSGAAPPTPRRSRGVARRAWDRPRADRSKVSPAGRTDGEIARMLLLEAGVSATQIDTRADAVALSGPRGSTPGPVNARPQSDTVLPGVAELVEELSRDPR